MKIIFTAAASTVETATVARTWKERLFTRRHCSSEHGRTDQGLCREGSRYRRRDERDTWLQSVRSRQLLDKIGIDSVCEILYTIIRTNMSELWKRRAKDQRGRSSFIIANIVSWENLWGASSETGLLAGYYFKQKGGKWIRRVLFDCTCSASCRFN